MLEPNSSEPVSLQRPHDVVNLLKSVTSYGPVAKMLANSP